MAGDAGSSSPSAPVPKIAGGFADPVLGAQVGFRAVLDALANPGIVHSVDVELPDVGIPVGALAMLLALVDGDTPVWTSTSVDDSTRAYLRFHSGARFASLHTTCAFAYVANVRELPDISSFSAGSAMSPEDSTTIIVCVDDFISGATAVLDGPGCREPRRVSPAGFTDSLWDELAKNHARFPVGVDLLLIAGRDIVGIPRSTRIDRVSALQEA